MATNNSVNTSLQGQTGTVAFVGSTSPTLVTPRIAQINDANGNPILALPPTASAVNYVSIVGNATGAPVSIRASGTDIDISMYAVTKGNAGFVIQTQATSIPPFIIGSGTGGQHTTNFLFTDSAITRNVSFPDASGTVALTNSTTATSWTPTMSFVTPGDLSISYSVQLGYYSVIGNILYFFFNITFTPTFTTSSGQFLITGLPAVIGVTPTYGSVITQNNVTYPAGTTYLTLNSQAGSSQFRIWAGGSANAGGYLTTTSFVTTLAVNIQGCGFYFLS